MDEIIAHLADGKIRLLLNLTQQEQNLFINDFAVRIALE
jgi:hypothetical protein